MNQLFRPNQWVSLSARSTALLAIFILLACLSGAAPAQEQEYKSVNTSTTEELIAAIEEANKFPDIFYIIYINEFLEFNEYYQDSEFALPPVRAGNTVFYFKADLPSWRPPAGPSLLPIGWLSSQAETLWLIGLALSDPTAKSENSPQSLSTSQNEDLLASSKVLTPPMFHGFDTIIDATNTIVVIDGISAECGEQCIRAENSRVIVSNSYFECDDDCIRVKGAGANTNTVDFDALREGVMGVDLSAAERTALLRAFDRAEQLLNNYDVAVVDSELRSQNAALVVLSGADSTRVLVDGSLLHTDSTGSAAVILGSTGAESLVHNSVISAPVSRTDALKLRNGEFTLRNTFVDAGEQGLIITDGAVKLGQVAIAMDPDNLQQACDKSFLSDEINSLGYNIVLDDSCELDGPGDLESTDPGLFMPEDGSLIPQFAQGSPAVDGGPAGIVDGALPCSLTDMMGIVRPQDGNGDGVFECDVGPIEAPGTGQVSAAHSAAFYNVNRNGEGNFVEILSDSRALVYTFTYRPDGSGPAWFIGLGDINGNSIFIEDLLRPIGTSFGDGFDAGAVELTPIGSMSMVFPDCEAANPGGNVVYTGDVELGYEALISRATRLSRITGCGAQTPGPNAGLSGSYFLRERNGEGIIVQWLVNGEVLVIFFTYDQNDNQFWVLGQAAADGNTVTINALYPSAYTSWGSGFNPGDITLSPWGTFTLTWTECNALTFAYASSVAGFGSATRNYTRLTTLSGTSCPEF